MNGEDESSPAGTQRQSVVGLRYDPDGDHAPRITAKGKGIVAERIIALAKEAGVPVREEPDLVAALSVLELDREIPPELYKAVAEILAFVYRMNKNAGRTGAGDRREAMGERG